MAEKHFPETRLVVAVVLLTAGVLWAWSRTGSYVQAEVAAVAGPVMIGGPGGGPGIRPERNPQQMREMMTKDLGLSEAQSESLRKSMEEMGPPRSPAEFQQRMARLREILTPEQQEKMRSVMKDRILNDPNSPARNLSPEDKEKFAQKLEQRLESGDIIGIGPPPGGPRP